MPPEPIYTAENCTPAYQLRWSLSLFANAELPAAGGWHDRLKTLVERDHVRLLEYQSKPPNAHLFLLSTKPNVSPPQIVKSVKGRLQTLIRDAAPKAFRRNFSLTSLGDTKRRVVEQYVATQLGHHRMSDVRVQDGLREFQLEFPNVDLSQAQFSTHGRYIYNLHLALVHRDRWRDVRRDRLEASRDMILRASETKGYRLSRVSLLADHLHLVLGCGYKEPPHEVALSYLNNLAYVQGMKDIYCYSYYVGTFGEYDMGAVRS
jgi:REP element-mobilizing transposase RayT